ncbi:hypothetical protein ES703_46481 [subsurface metagenome]
MGTGLSMQQRKILEIVRRRDEAGEATLVSHIVEELGNGRDFPDFSVWRSLIRLEARRLISRRGYRGYCWTTDEQLFEERFNRRTF